MSDEIHGSITARLPDGLALPPESGTLGDDQLRALFPARSGVGKVCQLTADAMKKYPDRLMVAGIDAETLALAGQHADDIDPIVRDCEYMLMKLKQANRLLDQSAHLGLRRVLAGVRALEKFDPTVTGLVKDLIDYFSNEDSSGTGREASSEPEPA